MTTQRKEGPLPSYENPPVIEVSIGVVFNGVDQLRAPHLGMLWDLLKSDYPRVEHAVPIGSYEVGAETIPPLPRVWFVHRDDDYVVQVQADRLLFNWRKRADRPYPRYEAIFAGFRNALTAFEKFLADVTPDPLMPQELSLEYINDIYKGEGWQEKADLGQFLRDVVWCEDERFLPRPTNIAWRTVFDIPDDQGQLLISSRFGQRKTDLQELLRIELKAVRKAPLDAKFSDVSDWYSVAHEWIVRGFADITTRRAQTEVWKRMA